MGKTLRDVLVAGQLFMVFRRRDDRQVDRPSFGRLADLLDSQPVGLAVQLLEVIGVLRVVDQDVVIANVEAKLFPRRCDLALRLKPGRH